MTLSLKETLLILDPSSGWVDACWGSVSERVGGATSEGIRAGSAGWVFMFDEETRVDLSLYTGSDVIPVYLI